MPSQITNSPFADQIWKATGYEDQPLTSHEDRNRALSWSYEESQVPSPLPGGFAKPEDFFFFLCWSAGAFTEIPNFNSPIP